MTLTVNQSLKREIRRTKRETRKVKLKTLLLKIKMWAPWFTPWRIWRDAARYRKLRHLMGCNVKWTWERVEQLGGICAWSSYGDMDEMLDRTDVEFLFTNRFDWAWEGDLGRDQILTEMLKK